MLTIEQLQGTYEHVFARNNGITLLKSTKIYGSGKIFDGFEVYTQNYSYVTSDVNDAIRVYNKLQQEKKPYGRE